MQKRLSFDDLNLPSEELQMFNEQTVQMRGFLYRLPQGSLVLAPQPNLKSCCVGQGPKLKQQVVIGGSLNQISQQQALTIEGVFKIDPQYDKEGQLTQYYTLEQVHIVTQENSIFPWKTVSGMGVFVMILALIFLQTKYKNNSLKSHFLNVLNRI